MRGVGGEWLLPTNKTFYGSRSSAALEFHARLSNAMVDARTKKNRRPEIERAMVMRRKEAMSQTWAQNNACAGFWCLERTARAVSHTEASEGRRRFPKRGERRLTRPIPSDTRRTLTTVSDGSGPGHLLQ